MLAFIALQLHHSARCVNRKLQPYGMLVFCLCFSLLGNIQDERILNYRQDKVVHTVNIFVTQIYFNVCFGF